MKTIEEQIKELKFGESIRLDSGEKYTRTFGGWIYSNFSGSAIYFIPVPAGLEIPVDSKELEAKTKKTEVEK